jgi:hypothetical protein
LKASRWGAGIDGMQLMTSMKHLSLAPVSCGKSSMVPSMSKESPR